MIDANQRVTFGDFESAWKKTMARGPATKTTRSDGSSDGYLL
jgi:hypothetical protein